LIPTGYNGYFTDTYVDITPTGVLNFNNGPKATDLNDPCIWITGDVVIYVGHREVFVCFCLIRNV